MDGQQKAPLRGGAGESFMEKSYRYINLKDFVYSVMIQLKPFLEDGACVHFKMPTTCETCVPEDFPVEHYARVYRSGLPESDKPSYIEFDVKKYI